MSVVNCIHFYPQWLYGGITSMNTDEENELCKSLTSIFEGQKIVELPYTVGIVADAV